MANYLLIAFKTLLWIMFVIILGTCGTSKGLQMYAELVEVTIFSLETYEQINGFVSLMESLLSLLVILLEFYCNISLIITSLRLMSKDIKAKPAGESHNPDAEITNSKGKGNPSQAQQKMNTANQIITPATQLLLLKVKEYRKLKLKMIFMFAAVGLIDILTLAMAACGTLHIFPVYESLLIVSSICGLHIYVSFTLLDLFLVELNRIKRLAAPKAMIPLKKMKEKSPLLSDFQSKDTSLHPSIKESAIDKSEFLSDNENSYSDFSTHPSVSKSLK